MNSVQRANDGLDALDYAIVRTLRADPTISNKALAAALGVAESTCAYRVRRLRNASVIGSTRLEIDHAGLGYSLKALVMVFLARHSREIVDQFMEHMVSQPNVLNVMNLTGRYDFMITVAVANAEALKSFVLNNVTTLPSVRGTETHIVFDVRDGEWVPTGPAA